jgi:hypothetical protein
MTVSRRRIAGPNVATRRLLAPQEQEPWLVVRRGTEPSPPDRRPNSLNEMELPNQ